MNVKQKDRVRKAGRARARIRLQERPRLCVRRTLNHIYAVITSPDGSKIYTVASTLDKSIKSGESTHGGNGEAAKLVGKLVAERAIKLGISEIAFDRSGYPYHGRVKALAEAAREQGLIF